jgi:16S rRNA G1207 methylase RsmC
MKYQFKYKNNAYKILISNNNVFKPTATTKFLLDALTKKKIKNKKILDLGCGSGIISIVLSKYTKKLFASDLLKIIIKNAISNFKYNNCNVETRYGNGLGIWNDKKFDIIICDIAGVSQNIASISPWYKNNVPCKTGKDGTDLIIETIKKSKKYLKKNGSLIIAVISLSNEKKIFKCIKKEFDTYEILSSNSWFLPNSMEKNIKFLQKQKKMGNINFQEKFGKLVANTKIIEAINVVI